MWYNLTLEYVPQRVPRGAERVFTMGLFTKLFGTRSEREVKKLEPQVEAVFDAISPDDEVLVLTDILAGSVNQKFLPYVAPNVFVVAGVNVVLAMELCLAPAPLTAEGVQNAIDMAGQSIKLLNTIQVEDDEDDE